MSVLYVLFNEFVSLFLSVPSVQFGQLPNPIQSNLIQGLREVTIQLFLPY